MSAHPSTEPAAERVVAWVELSELFVGRELDPADYVLMARRLHSTGLALSELERTLWDEVEPVFGSNIGLWNPTPEMIGWSARSVEDAVRAYLRRPRGQLRTLLHRWLSPRAVRRIPQERWIELKKALLEQGAG